MIKGIYFGLIIGLCSFAISSCTNSNDSNQKVDSVKVRIKEEPDRLHPILSKTGISQQIESRIFLPLMAPDPETFSLRPVLIKGEPNITEKENGGLEIEFRLRENARWPNGAHITADDVAFSIKSIFAPGMEESNLRAYFDSVDSLTYSNEDSLAFSFHLRQSYILALPATAGLNILPEHHYDPNKALSKFSLREIKTLDTVTSSLEEWAEFMKSPELSRNNILGSGPYSLESWETGRYIKLTKTSDWWGEDHPVKNPLLKSNPENIFYQIIPDESTAIQLLKAGDLDIVSDLSPLQVTEFLQDSSLTQKFKVLFTNVLNQYVILLNTKDNILKDKAVRKALSHLVNADQFINEVLQGFGSPAYSPIHPSKPFFDSTLKRTAFSIETAKQILNDAGWLDLENTGLREKYSSEGNRHPLSLELLITGSSLSQSIALRLKENAALAGIDIEIVTLPFRNILKKMKSGDFQMTPLSIRSSPFPYDPYQTWHSDNIGGTGSNYTRFGNDSSDRVIERIRNQSDPKQALEAYQKFQKLVNEHVPVLYLAAPLQPLIISKNLNLPLTAMKPGYFENAVEISPNDSISY
ncbi:MAG: hypothetical protein GVX78_05685 [Bacteroidetes bacterium]|jgi:peptide/nickel transport system substrate-binding protein|nr:hypothetical protein [Bacteroidota bacterium]